MASQTSTVPSQQRVRGDDPTQAEPAGQRLGDRAEQSPVVLSDGWFRVLASKDRELVA
jgi:hypothetical protein